MAKKSDKKKKDKKAKLSKAKKEKKDKKDKKLKKKEKNKKTKKSKKKKAKEVKGVFEIVSKGKKKKNKDKKEKKKPKPKPDLAVSENFPVKHETVVKKVSGFNDHSSKYNTKAALALMRSLGSEEDIRKFVKGEKRITITRSVNAAIKKLGIG